MIPPDGWEETGDGRARCRRCGLLVKRWRGKTRIEHQCLPWRWGVWVKARLLQLGLGPGVFWKACGDSLGGVVCFAGECRCQARILWLDHLGAWCWRRWERMRNVLWGRSD